MIELLKVVILACHLNPATGTPTDVNWFAKLELQCRKRLLKCLERPTKQTESDEKIAIKCITTIR